PVSDETLISIVPLHLSSQYSQFGRIQCASANPAHVFVYSSMPTRNEIESMIFLLEDPDPQVHGPVRQHMVRLGETAVPLIDGIRAGTKNGATAKTLGDILHEITFATLEQEFLLL